MYSSVQDATEPRPYFECSICAPCAKAGLNAIGGIYGCLSIIVTLRRDSSQRPRQDPSKHGVAKHWVTKQVVAGPPASCLRYSLVVDAVALQLLGGRDGHGLC